MAYRKLIREIVSRLQDLLLESRRTAMTAVNAEMLRAYWEMGKVLVEAEDQGALPGDVLEKISGELVPEFGKAFTARKLSAVKEFYREYAHRPPLIRFHERNELAETGLPPLNPRLSWTHYRLFLTLEDEGERKAAERMTLEERWSVEELERRIREGASAECDEKDDSCQDEPSHPEDFASDPHVRAFIGVPQKQRLTETVLEGALIDHLQKFLLEKGRDLYLVERQKKTTIDGEDVYTDLLFYSRPLHAFLAAELVCGEFSEEDERRMERVLRKIMEDGKVVDETENPPAGLLLSVRREGGRMEYLFLPEAEALKDRYRFFLPAEDDLAAELEGEREEVINRYPFLEE
ncbi:PDDEXK nuclease domain-containing protein [Aminivibrio sp.]|uniref:PDDEXK nuclease domain-containing protein n=1 Tax=Aminivibrio sp. TaxID=1872489 RepID=UPI00345ED0D2